MMSQPQTDDLAHAREQFEHWRSQSSGRSRIPDRLWRMAIDMLDHVSPSVLCGQLHLAAGDLKKRRLELTPARDAAPPLTPAFVELRAVDLTGPPHQGQRPQVEVEDVGADLDAWWPARAARRPPRDAPRSPRRAPPERPRSDRRATTAFRAGFASFGSSPVPCSWLRRRIASGWFHRRLDPSRIESVRLGVRKERVAG